MLKLNTKSNKRKQQKCCGVFLLEYLKKYYVLLLKMSQIPETEFPMLQIIFRNRF